MVRTATLPQFSPNRPDPSRIAAISFSIAANMALFAFLMQPQSYSLPAESHVRSLPIIIVPKLEDRVLPILPQPPQPPQPPLVRQPLPLPPRLPLVPRPQVLDPNTGPMDTLVQQPLNGVVSGSVDIRPPAPVQTSLSPIASPAPVYPIEAIRDGITGTVQLELLVGVDGHVLEARIVRSSGDRRLDAAAREQVLRNWRFQPAVQNGMPVQALGVVPIVFNLDGQ